MQTKLTGVTVLIDILRVQSAFAYGLSIHETVLSVNADVVERMT